MLQEITICGGVHHSIVAIVKYDDSFTFHPAITIIDNVSTSSLLSSSPDIIARTGFISHLNLCDNNRKCFGKVIIARNRHLSNSALKIIRALPVHLIPSYSTMRMKFLNFFFYTIRYESNKDKIILIQSVWRRWVAIRYVKKKRSTKMDE